LPNLNLINMAQGFQAFVSKIGPLVDGWEFMYNLITLKDTQNSLLFLLFSSYAIVYQETVIKLAVFLPILVILFIFYNYYYEREFKRPKNTYIRNIKLVQALMNLTGDMFEFQYYFIENCLYWKS
jgi:hypothetical protein